MAIFHVIGGEYKNLDAVKKTLGYISRDTQGSKEDVYAVGGYGIDYENVKNAEKQFLTVKKIWEKEDKRQVVHGVVSFGRDEMERIEKYNIEKLSYSIGRIICKDEFQARWSIHIDTDNIHIHYIINSVSYCTGLKYRFEPREVLEINQRINALIEPYMRKVVNTMEEFEMR